MRFFDEITGLANKDKRVITAFLLLIAIVPIALFVYIYGTRDGYTVVFNELSGDDVYRIASLLEENGIKYRFDTEKSGVSVSDSDVHTSRMLVMQSNIISSENVGFEIFNESEFGMTEFSQKINYQRALQGELSRTISSLDEIDFARLHIVQPSASIFEDKEQEPRASVTLFVKRGMLLSQNQISGIQRIIAYSIDNMDVSNVVVSDQRGNILSEHKSKAASIQEEKLLKKQSIESLYKRKIEEAIRPHVEDGKYSISVNVNLDYTKIKKSKESYLNDNALIASEKVSSGKGGKSMLKDVVYKHGKEIVTEESEYGSINNIQSAVLINYTIPQDKVDMLNEVVLRAIGFNQARGDVVTVHAAEFPKYGDGVESQITSASKKPVSDIKANINSVSTNKISGHSSYYESIPVTVEKLIIAMLAMLTFMSLWIVYLKLRERNTISLTQKKRDDFAKELNNWLAKDDHG